MNKKWIFSVGLPLALVTLYLAGMLLFPDPSNRLYKAVHSEWGVIEIGTAVFYAVAAALTLRLYFRLRLRPEISHRWFFLAATAVFLFIALEEINYGQFFFGFSTPDPLAIHNTKEEFNLHNMFGNTPAHRLNLVATFGFLIGFAVLPFVIPRKKQTGLFLFLPRRNLVLYAVIAQMLSWLDDISGWFGVYNCWVRATEFKEFYWSLMVLLWSAEMSVRLLQGARVASTQALCQEELRRCG